MADKWIQGANLHEGAFTRKAKAAHTSVHALAEKKKGAEGTTGKQARLALTFERMRNARRRGQQKGVASS